MQGNDPIGDIALLGKTLGNLWHRPRDIIPFICRSARFTKMSVGTYKVSSS